MRQFLFVLFIAAALTALACGGSSSGPAGKSIKSGPAGNNITATIANSDGVLKKGKQDLTLTFADASGKPVDVGTASLNFYMPPMGSMAAMNNAAALTTTSTPGVYSARVDVEMSGEWQAQIKYDGPAGKGSATLAVTAQ